MAWESHTIVRKVRGGADGGRFALLSEQANARQFVFRPVGTEMSLTEVCVELIAHGISEQDAVRLIAEAIDNFDGVPPA
jgi:hypothetical protein